MELNERKRHTHGYKRTFQLLTSLEGCIFKYEKWIKKKQKLVQGTVLEYVQAVKKPCNKEIPECECEKLAEGKFEYFLASHPVSKVTTLNFI